MKSSLRKLFAKVTTFLIVVSLVNLLMPSAAVLASPRSGTVATGIIRVSGTVMIDGVRGTSGQTLFPRSQITTDKSSESIIDLGKFTRLRLLAETHLMLDFSEESISSTLWQGTLRGFIPAGVPLSINTAGGELRIDPSQPSEFIVQVRGQNIEVSVKAGHVELTTENKLHSISAGEFFMTSANSQTEPEDQDGLTGRQKVGLFAAIGTAAAILIIVLRGREEEQLQFGGCVIVPSGETPSICP